MIHGTYIGVRKRLFNKGAILQEKKGVDSYWLAQFDPLNVREAFGWHSFLKTDFTNIEGDEMFNE